MLSLFGTATSAMVANFFMVAVMYTTGAMAYFQFSKAKRPEGRGYSTAVMLYQYLTTAGFMAGIVAFGGDVPAFLEFLPESKALACVLHVASIVYSVALVGAMHHLYLSKKRHWRVAAAGSAAIAFAQAVVSTIA